MGSRYHSPREENLCLAGNGLEGQHPITEALLGTCFLCFGGSGKLFEVIYIILWLGMMNSIRNQAIPFIDYIGAMEESQTLGIANFFLGITVVFLVFAVLGRKRQIMV